MRRCLLALLAALVLAAPASAAAPRVDARAWLVQNGTTGEVLVQHDADRRVPIASITKLMTVLVALARTDPDDGLVVPRQAAAVGESTIHLRAGERVTVHDLIEAALIQSANDAATALALHVSGSIPSFAVLMNRKAAQLGLRETHFVRPDGLDVAGHVSSARDVTTLARVAMNDPTVRSIVRLRSADAAGRHLFTWNDLLGRFPGIIGVKTGHTSAAGWSQVAAARGRRSSARRPGRRATRTSASCSPGACPGTASCPSSRKVVSMRARPCRTARRRWRSSRRAAR